MENADALTVRVRAGLEIGLSENFAILGEVEGTLAPIQDYNSTTNGKTDFSTIADPQNIELTVFICNIEVLKARSSRWGVNASTWMTSASRSEEHTSELQSLMRISYAVFCLKKKKTHKPEAHQRTQ